MEVYFSATFTGWYVAFIFVLFILTRNASFGNLQHVIFKSWKDVAEKVGYTCPLSRLKLLLIVTAGWLHQTRLRIKGKLASDRCLFL